MYELLKLHYSNERQMREFSEQGDQIGRIFAYCVIV
jgi:hypothetical protein